MASGPRIYNLFPLLCGSLRQWEEHLPRIAALGFDWVYVNPFHYPGFSGSLYAVKDYYRINDLFRDGERTLEELLGSFCAKARELGVSVIMDLVINHTAKDSLLAAEHPEWFLHEADGSLRSPRAIDPADARRVTIWGRLGRDRLRRPGGARRPDRLFRRHDDALRRVRHPRFPLRRGLPGSARGLVTADRAGARQAR